MVWLVQVVRVARTTSLDDIHSEDIWFSWYKPSKYREKLICHACDGGRTNGGRKVENSAVFCWTRNRKKSKKIHDIQCRCNIFTAPTQCIGMQILYNLDLTPFNDFCSQQKLGYERKCARPPQTQSNAVDEQKPHQVAASLNKIK